VVVAIQLVEFSAVFLFLFLFLFCSRPFLSGGVCLLPVSGYGPVFSSGGLFFLPSTRRSPFFFASYSGSCFLHSPGMMLWNPAFDLGFFGTAT
jgi:hypothetical protein